MNVPHKLTLIAKPVVQTFLEDKIWMEKYRQITPLPLAPFNRKIHPFKGIHSIAYSLNEVSQSCCSHYIFSLNSTNAQAFFLEA
jgi:hypothetical protein